MAGHEDAVAIPAVLILFTQASYLLGYGSKRRNCSYASSPGF
jgi:hypothetical protein